VLFKCNNNFSLYILSAFGALSLVLFYIMVLIINMNGVAITVQPQMNGVFNVLL
jgi:hypothetical protein